MLSAAVLSLLMATPAERLDAAAAALDALEFERVLATLPSVSEVTGFSREQVERLFAVRALALVSLRREDEASEAFRQLFAVAPDWKLPEQYGPRIRTLAGSAAAEAEEKGVLGVTYEAGKLRVGKDAYGFATAFELTWRVDGSGPTTRTFPVGVTIPAPWAPDRRIDTWGRIVGLAGSTLLEWNTPLAPLRIEPALVTEVPQRRSSPLRPLVIAGIAVGAVALAAGGAAVGFAGASTEAERALASASRDAEGRITSLTQRDAFLIEQRSATAATLSGVFFVTAGVLAAGSVGLLVFDRVRATPAPGGVSLTVPLDATFGLAAAGGAR
jgi:hypothetical protein